MRGSRAVRHRVRQALAASALAMLVTCDGVLGETPAFRVEALAEGVSLYRPADPGHARTNSLVVQRTDGLLVVDSQPTPEAARDLLSAIAERSPAPVRYLVLSHPHAESAGGASAFPESTLVIGSGECLRALEDEAYDFGAEMRARATGPDPWVEPPRRPPVLVVLGTTDLDDSLNPVSFRVLNHAHSRGDLMVYLPEADIMSVGALLFHDDGNPYAGDANVSGWLAALNGLARQSPTRIVATHGPPIDGQRVRIQRDALAWIRGRVEHGFIERIAPERIPQHVLDTAGIEEHFDPRSEPSFVRLLVEQVLAETVAQRKKRGLL